MCTFLPPESLYQSCSDLRISAWNKIAIRDSDCAYHSLLFLFLAVEVSITNLVLNSAHRLFKYVQSRCCPLACSQVEPAHISNDCCCKLKIIFRCTQTPYPPPPENSSISSSSVFQLRGNPYCSCTTGRGWSQGFLALPASSLLLPLRWNERWPMKPRNHEKNNAQAADVYYDRDFSMQETGILRYWTTDPTGFMAMSLQSNEVFSLLQLCRVHSPCCHCFYLHHVIHIQYL